MDAVYSTWNMASSLANDTDQYHMSVNMNSDSTVDCGSSTLASIWSDSSVFNLLNTSTTSDHNMTSTNSVETTMASTPTSGYMISAYDLLESEYAPTGDQQCDPSAYHLTSVSGLNSVPTSYSSSLPPMQGTESYQLNSKAVFKPQAMQEPRDRSGNECTENGILVNSVIQNNVVYESSNDRNCHTNHQVNDFNSRMLNVSSNIGHSSSHQHSFASNSQTFATNKRSTKYSYKRSVDSENRRSNQQYHSSSSQSSLSSSPHQHGKSSETSKLTPRNREKFLSPEDEERRRRRRERNKVAATKCRNKKKNHVIKLCQESELLETANRDLKEEIQCLEREQQQLKSIFQRHLPYCCIVAFQS